MNTTSAPVNARQAILDECMPIIGRIARKWARVAPLLEEADLFQEGCLAILTHLDRLPDPEHTPDPSHYLVVVARNAIISAAMEARCVIRVPSSSQRINSARVPRVVSLDVPLSQDADAGTLHDILPGPAPAQVSRLPRVTRLALLRAVRRLPKKQRLTLCLKYGLPTYTKEYPSHNVVAARNHALATLRNNPELRKAVQT